MLDRVYWRQTAALAACLVGLAGCTTTSSSGASDGTTADDDAAGDTGTDDGAIPEDCARAMPAALGSCLVEFSLALAECYEAGTGTCGVNSGDEVLDELEASVLDSCADEAAFGLEASALAGRLRNACASEMSSLAWRSYGGPQGDPYDTLSGDAQDCLTCMSL
ncbi:MAG: hypothetical protein ACPHRO_08180, partial [Nannocystaceae bacterium]